MLTQAAFARELGVSRQYVSAMAKRGKLPINPDGTIDPAAARAALAAHADPAMDPVAASHAARRVGRNSPDPAAPHVAQTSPAMGAPIGRYIETPLSRAKAADAVYSAKTRQMEYERAIGKLVEAAEVVRAIGAISPAMQQFETLPERVVARIRAAADDRAGIAILAAELDAARQSVADFSRSLIDRLTVNTQ